MAAEGGQGGSGLGRPLPLSSPDPPPHLQQPLHDPRYAKCENVQQVILSHRKACMRGEGETGVGRGVFEGGGMRQNMHM